jgi:hypothetical protein
MVPGIFAEFSQLDRILVELARDKLGVTGSSQYRHKRERDWPDYLVTSGSVDGMAVAELEELLSADGKRFARAG